MRSLIAGALIGLAFTGTAQAAPLEKLATYRPFVTKPLTMKRAERAAMRYMRTEAHEEYATDPDVYACERRTRYVVDCDGDMTGESCHHLGDLLGPCAPGTERTDTLVNLVRIRSKLGFTLVRERSGPEL